MSRSDTAGKSRRAPGSLDGPVLGGPVLGGPVLVSNLGAGTLLLGVLAFGSWPLAVLGAAYLAAASMFLAAVYATPVLTRRQEAAAWIAPWVAAVALWTWVLGGVEGGTSAWLLNGWAGLVVATLGYVAWQALALAVRQLMAWRARPAGPR